MVDILNIPVHPAAEEFPMLGDEEMGELEKDIKENGLNNSLVLSKIDGKMFLVDGRNRREVCRRLGITPKTITLHESQDPIHYIVSQNIKRRHLTTGQIAMLLEKLVSQPDIAQLPDMVDEGLEIPQQRKSDARIIMNNAPELVDDVISGELSLQRATKKAREKKKTRKTKKQQALEYLEKHPEASTVEVMESLNVGRCTVERAKTQMRRSGNHPYLKHIKKEARIGQIRSLVSDGFSVAQIAQELKLTEEYVGRCCWQHGIEVVRAKKTESAVVISGVIDAAGAAVFGLRSSIADVDGTIEDLERWEGSLKETLRDLGWLKRKIDQRLLEAKEQ